MAGHHTLTPTGFQRFASTQNHTVIPRINAVTRWWGGTVEERDYPHPVQIPRAVAVAKQSPSPAHLLWAIAVLVEAGSSHGVGWRIASRHVPYPRRQYLISTTVALGVGRNEVRQRRGVTPMPPRSRTSVSDAAQRRSPNPSLMGHSLQARPVALCIPWGWDRRIALPISTVGRRGWVCGTSDYYIFIFLFLLSALVVAKYII